MAEEQKTGFFDEEPGQKSTMRLISFSTIATILGTYLVQNGFAIYRAIERDAAINPVAFGEGSVVILAVAVLGKSGQKAIENIEKISDAIAKLGEAFAKIKGLK